MRSVNKNGGNTHDDVPGTRTHRNIWKSMCDADGVVVNTHMLHTATPGFGHGTNDDCEAASSCCVFAGLGSVLQHFYALLLLCRFFFFFCLPFEKDSFGSGAYTKWQTPTERVRWKTGREWEWEWRGKKGFYTKLGSFFIRAHNKIIFTFHTEVKSLHLSHVHSMEPFSEWKSTPEVLEMVRLSGICMSACERWGPLFQNIQRKVPSAVIKSFHDETRCAVVYRHHHFARLQTEREKGKRRTRKCFVLRSRYGLRRVFFPSPGPPTHRHSGRCFRCLIFRFSRGRFTNGFNGAISSPNRRNAVVTDTIIDNSLLFRLRLSSYIGDMELERCSVCYTFSLFFFPLIFRPRTRVRDERKGNVVLWLGLKW